MIKTIALYYENNNKPIIYHTDQGCFLTSKTLTIYDYDNDEEVTFVLSNYHRIIIT